MRWRSCWLRREGDSLPYNTLDVLLSAKKIHTYRFLEVVLQILTTGPVTTATNERSFSAVILNLFYPWTSFPFFFSWWTPL